MIKRSARKHSHDNVISGPSSLSPLISLPTKSHQATTKRTTPALRNANNATKVSPPRKISKDTITVSTTIPSSIFARLVIAEKYGKLGRQIGCSTASEGKITG
jgi:hypothetical protein